MRSTSDNSLQVLDRSRSELRPGPTCERDRKRPTDNLKLTCMATAATRASSRRCCAGRLAPTHTIGF